MTYRDDDGPLAERFDSIKKSLDEVRVQSTALAQEELSLNRQLEDVRGAIARKTGGEQRRHLPLANVQIAAPCSASWEAMVGDERRRHCEQCSRDVYDLTVMTRDEVDAFLVANASGACVRLYQRTDGRMLTEDCPVGVRRRRMRALTAAGVGLGTCALVAFTALSTVIGVRELEPARLPPPPPIVVTPPIGTTPPVGTIAADPTQKSGIGFVWVEAPEGTRIYEGEKLLGAAPLQFAAIEGTHVLRGVDPKTNKSTSAIAFVRPQEISAISINPNAPRVRRLMGAMRAAPDPVDGANRF